MSFFSMTFRKAFSGTDHKYNQGLFWFVNMIILLDIEQMHLKSWEILHN